MELKMLAIDLAQNCVEPNHGLNFQQTTCKYDQTPHHEVDPL
jgi:hypothetical protein